MFYVSNPGARKEKHLTQAVWTGKIIVGLLRLSLGLWNDRCKALHGKDEAENKKKRKDRLVKQIKIFYKAHEKIPPEANYLFKEKYGDLCKRSLQYFEKWVASYILAAKGTGDKKQPKQRRRKTGKHKKDMGSASEQRDIKNVRPYSQQHAEWLGGVKNGEIREPGMES